MLPKAIGSADARNVLYIHVRSFNAGSPRLTNSPGNWGGDCYNSNFCQSALELSDKPWQNAQLDLAGWRWWRQARHSRVELLLHIPIDHSICMNNAIVDCRLRKNQLGYVLFVVPALVSVRLNVLHMNDIMYCTYYVQASALFQGISVRDNYCTVYVLG